MESCESRPWQTTRAAAAKRLLLLLLAVTIFLATAQAPSPELSPEPSAAPSLQPSSAEPSPAPTNPTAQPPPAPSSPSAPPTASPTEVPSFTPSYLQSPSAPPGRQGQMFHFQAHLRWLGLFVTSTNGTLYPATPTLRHLATPVSSTTPRPSPQSAFFIPCRTNCPTSNVPLCAYFQTCGNGCFCGTAPGVPSPLPTQPTVAPTPSCRGGFYLSDNSSTCIPCIAGTYRGELDCQSSSSCCYECGAGSFSNAGDEQCRPCPPGSYSSYSGASACTLCPKGYYSLFDPYLNTGAGIGGYISCNQCAIGSYSDTIGASSCQNCVNGTTTNSSGYTAKTDCQACAAGTYSTGGNSCKSCHGSWSFKGSATCTKCVAGKYSSVFEKATNASVCLDCAPGTYSDSGSTGCLDCQSGYYSLQGAASCSPCKTSMYGSNVTGCSMNPPCIPGLYSPHFNVSCKPCAPGTHSSTQGATACDLCPPGTYGDAKGMPSCNACSRNTYLQGIGSISASACQACSKNKITTIEGATSPDACFDPIPNYFIGAFVLLLSMVAAWKYTFLGRFHRVAFLRRHRVVLPTVQLMREVHDMVDFAKKRSQELNERSKKKRDATQYYRMLKTLLFVLLSLIDLVVGTVILFFVKVNSVIFSAMIIYRGLLTVYFYKAKLFLHLISDSVERLVEAIRLPALRQLFAPFVKAYSVLANIDINFKAVGITCAGAQAPYALFANLCILGFVVVVIESDGVAFFASSFTAFHKSFTATLFFQRHFADTLGWGRYKLARFLLYSLVASIYVALEPLSKMLQWIMGFLSFSSFIDHQGLHDWSDGCDGGLYGPTDKVLAVITTLVAFLIVGPVTYEIGRLLIPEGLRNVAVKDPPEWRESEQKRAVHEKSIVDMREGEAGKISLLGTILKFIPTMLSVDLYLSIFQSAWMNSIHKNVSDSRGRETLANASHREHGLCEPEGFVWRIFLSMFQSRTSEEDKAWDEQYRAELPAYKGLCDYVFQTLEERAYQKNKDSSCDRDCVEHERDYWFLCCIFFPCGIARLLCFYVFETKHSYFGKKWNRFISFIPLVQLWTPVGREFWALIMRQYASFTLVSLGIWTPYTVRCFNLKQRYAEIASVGDDSLATSSHPRDSLENAKKGMPAVRSKARRDKFSKFLSGLVGSRAVLFQIIPSLAVLTVLGIGLAPTPIYFPQGEDGEVLLNDYLIMEPYEEARLRLKEEEKLSDEGLARIKWIVQLMGVQIFFAESRGIQIVFNLFSFILSVVALFPENNNLFVIFSFVFLVPNALLQSLVGIIWLGKYMSITDGDLIGNAEKQAQSAQAAPAEAATAHPTETFCSKCSSRLVELSFDPYKDSGPGYGVCNGCNVADFYTRDGGGYHCMDAYCDNNFDLCFECVEGRRGDYIPSPAAPVGATNVLGLSPPLPQVQASPLYSAPAHNSRL